MDQQAMGERAAAVLAAWNSYDVDRVVACYTEDCIYRDPNTRGVVAGREALRRYLSRLFADWRMHWSLREFFAFADGSGGAFLWHATLTPGHDPALPAPLAQHPRAAAGATPP
jgi:nuclear transport factor 2 (NTF2) superfamily protein